MTDMSTAKNADPNRPWIRDERDSPSNMNWISTLLNPFGDSSRVHFTRAQTLLFFLSLPFFAAGLMGFFDVALGGFIALTILSSISHIRRLSDAQRPEWLAAISLVPLIAALAMFAVSLPSAVEGANKVISQIEMDLADPEAAKQRRAEAREKAQAEREKAKAEGKEPKRRGGRDRGPKWTAENYSSYKFIKEKAGSPAFGVWGLAALLTLLWTTFWVARLPTGGGTIKERLAREAEELRY